MKKRKIQLPDECLPGYEPPFDLEPTRTCRVCGCTDMDCRGCIARTGQPCSWVAEDLCSACVDQIAPSSVHHADIIQALRKKRFPLQDEKLLQSEIGHFLGGEFPKLTIQREYHFDKDNIIDFLLDSHIGVEVKIKGGKRAIFKQCERYCEFDKVKIFILITNITMGFPEEINGKSCYVVKLGQPWL